MGGVPLYKTSKTAEGSATGVILILAGVFGITNLINDKPKTPAYKEFMKIESSQNKSNKEKIAYEALVSLAEESRKSKKSIRNSSKANNSVENLALELVALSILKQHKDKLKIKNFFCSYQLLVLLTWPDPIPQKN